MFYNKQVSHVTKHKKCFDLNHSCDLLHAGYSPLLCEKCFISFFPASNFRREAYFPFVNGRCHFERSMPALVTWIKSKQGQTTLLSLISVNNSDVEAQVEFSLKVTETARCHLLLM